MFIQQNNINFQQDREDAREVTNFIMKRIAQELAVNNNVQHQQVVQNVIPEEYRENLMKGFCNVTKRDPHELQKLLDLMIGAFSKKEDKNYPQEIKEEFLSLINEENKIAIENYMLAILPMLHNCAPSVENRAHKMLLQNEDEICKIIEKIFVDFHEIYNDVSFDICPQFASSIYMKLFLYQGQDEQPIKLEKMPQKFYDELMGLFIYVSGQYSKEEYTSIGCDMAIKRGEMTKEQKEMIMHALCEQEKIKHEEKQKRIEIRNKISLEKEKERLVFEKKREEERMNKKK